MAHHYSEAGKLAVQKSELRCPLCDGKGRILSATRQATSRKGGNASYMKSLEPGELSMKERGRRGGRPRALRLEDLKESNSY